MVMRTYWLVGLTAIAFTATGCTGHQLRRTTVSQASTLTDLQYQLVLDNLAMFAANPSALPWHVNLKNGSSQVADSGAASLVGSWGTMMSRLATGTPGVNGSRTIVEQWGNVPVTDDNALQLLQIAYRRAFGFPETLDNDDFADDLAQDLKDQISVSLYSQSLTKDYDDDLNAKIDRLFRRVNRVGISRSRLEVSKVFQPLSDENRIVQQGELVASPDFLIEKSVEVKVRDALNITQEQVDLADQIVKAAGRDSDVTNPSDEPVTQFRTSQSPIIKEVRRLLKKTEDDLEKTPSAWFGVGCRKDEVPANACFIGHYQDRCGERFVWVCPDHREELTKFTLEILSLSDLIKDRQIVSVPGGPAYAPPTAYSR
jgi:hypothetical protein